MLIFDPNLKIPVLTGKKLFKYWRKNIPVKYLPKRGYLLAKNLKWVSDQFENQHAIKFCSEKTLKITFWSGPNSFGKWNLKIQIFDVIFSSSKYLMCCFEASVQLIPKSYSHPSCSLLELQLILVQISLPHLAMFNWSPNIHQKWNY